MRAVSVSVTVFFAVFISDASVSSEAQQRAMSFFVTKQLGLVQAKDEAEAIANAAEMYDTRAGTERGRQWQEMTRVEHVG